MSNKAKQSKEKAKLFAKEMVQRFQQLIAQHNDKIFKLNEDVRKNDRIQKIPPKKNDSEGQFYKYAEDTAQKIILMNKKLASAEKIKKQSRTIYETKISTMVGYIKELVQNQAAGIKIEPWLVKWTQQIGQLSQQIAKSLTLLQKQSKGFCFGGDNTTKHFVQRSIIDLIGYCQSWHLIGKCSPLVQRQIQNKYIQLDYDESIFNDVDKMIISMWPEPQIIQVQVQRIVEKVVVKDKQKSDHSIIQDTSIKHELQRRQLTQKNQKLNKQLHIQKTLREAHELLIGLGRSQNIPKAIDIYLNIPEMHQSQARQSIKTETQLKINPLICNVLGCLYEQGKYVTRDLNKACEYYIKSASVQDAQGMYKIAKFLQKRMVNPAQLFQQGYATRSQQIKDAIQHYEKAAQKGHLDAITDLGHIYQNGIKRQQDRGEHSAVSQSEVSEAQAQDYIIEPNFEHAVKYYTIAKKQDFPRALNNLGAMYIRLGDKISQTVKGTNIERGIKYLKRATDLKYSKAFLNFGKCYQKGIGVKKNIEKARSLYIEGAQLDDSQCKLEFIKCMLNNQVAIQGKIDVKIHQFLRQILLAQPNNAQALYLMGIFQEKGIGVQKNQQGAYYYIHKSAKLDHSPSLIKLGDYYYSGYHIGKDIEKAKICYEKAAMKGNSQGFINLGLLYQNGLMGPQSHSQQKQIATNYFLQAAKLGNPNALLFLNKEGASPDHMKQAAEMGSTDALKLLAKTNTTADAQAKTFEKSRSQYKNLVNKFIKEANRVPEITPKHRQFRRIQAPASPRMREMMIYSPRERPHATSNIFSPRYMSPSYRQGNRSQAYFQR